MTSIKHVNFLSGEKLEKKVSFKSRVRVQFLNKDLGSTEDQINDSEDQQEDEKETVTNQTAKSRWSREMSKRPADEVNPASVMYRLGIGKSGHTECSLSIFCDLSFASTGLLLAVKKWSTNKNNCRLGSLAKMSCSSTCRGWVAVNWVKHNF